jgi:hypothetical protein
MAFSSLPGDCSARDASDSTPASARSFGDLTRDEFNRRAVEYAVPLFWVVDANKDGALDPQELTVVWGLGEARLDQFVRAGTFTAEFAKTHDRLRKPVTMAGLAPSELARREAVLTELSQGRPTLIQTRFSTPEDLALIARLGRAARLVEKVFARQSGVHGMASRIPSEDTASRAMFSRNQGPYCEAPKTESNPACSALADRPARISGLYPASIQSKPGFCEALEKREDGDSLMAPFVVVRHRNGGRATGNAATDDLVAVPYHVAFAEDMKAISAELAAAAAVLEHDPSESALSAYLLAASAAFLDGDWFVADIAWKAMSATNSKWYLRVGPDEVFFDPCSRKAGFHMTIARINPGSLVWQRKLGPAKGEMETVFAGLAGAPYEAREVGFVLPDFIDIVLNAGDDRKALEATIGQSLPNWGPVAESGGRTLAMTNLYTDPDSEAAFLQQASSLFCKATMARVVFAPELVTVSTVLHEAGHNLGPSHGYRVDGRTRDQVFGGTLASMLEELKAQNASLYFPQWLVERGMFDRASAESEHLLDVTWAFGQIAQGMSDAGGNPKIYPQLAAIQLGYLQSRGALPWMSGEKAANGTDQGCFEVDFERWQPAAEDLLRTGLQIQSRGDRSLAEQMRNSWVSDATPWASLREIIQTRWRRAPMASLVYSVQPPYSD